MRFLQKLATYLQEYHDNTNILTRSFSSLVNEKHDLVKKIALLVEEKNKTKESTLTFSDLLNIYDAFYEANGSLTVKPNKNSKLDTFLYQVKTALDLHYPNIISFFDRVSGNHSIAFLYHS